MFPIIYGVLSSLVAALLLLVAGPAPYADANDPPQIHNFVGENILLDIWVFTGDVTDANEDPDGWTVTMTGVTSGTTTLNIDDGFEYYQLVEQPTFGYAVATVDDTMGGEGAAAYLVHFP